MSLKALIIDDEAGARITLQKLIEMHCPTLTVVGNAENVPEGVKAIHRLKPDVVFLDIEMPEYNGFELLDFFSEISFEIVFVTAYSQYALRAFEVAAVDYLLKPVEVEHLMNTSAKLEKSHEHKELNQQLEVLKSVYQGNEVRKIALPMSDGLIFVDIMDIIYFEADRSYTIIHMKNGVRHTVSKSLRTFEDVLIDKPIFFRPHRSFLFNVHFIQHYAKGDGLIKLENGHIIGISREKKQDFEQLLKELRITI